ncbi:MAG TPA: DUF1569 domain-containing protein [Chitinophagaceae bacterium]
MKSVFDSTTRSEIINRINAVSPQNSAQWGKMNAYQMVKHCTLCEDMFLGKINIKRVFIGRLLGPMVLKKVLKDEKPFGKNSPTSPILKTTSDSGDIEQQKKEWISRIEEYAAYNNSNYVHPFFGPMTKEQVGLFAYKHADHHLRQFGA